MKKLFFAVLTLSLILAACAEYETESTGHEITPTAYTNPPPITESPIVTDPPAPETFTVTQYLLTETVTQLARTGDFMSTRYYYAPDGRLEYSIVEQNGVESYRLTYTYDESGKTATGSGSTSDGIEIINEVVYDDAGNPLRSVTFNIVDEKRIPLTSTDNSYDSNGNLTQQESKCYLSGDLVTHTLTVYSYDENGHPLTVTTFNELDGSGGSCPLYCDRNGNIILPFSADGSVTYRSYDDHGNLVATESYLRGAFIQCTINQYTAIESVQAISPKQSITIDTTADDAAIGGFLSKVFSRLQEGDLTVLADALPDKLLSLAESSETDYTSYFSGDRVLEKCYQSDDSIQISVRKIVYHPSASHFIDFFKHAPDDTKLIYTSILENSTTAAVFIDIEEEFGTSVYIAFLYRYEGSWYYLVSIPMYIAG